ncbi:MAG: hypothetical protein ACFCVG_16485 [Kineosporiaceae bacterium]
MAWSGRRPGPGVGWVRRLVLVVLVCSALLGAATTAPPAGAGFVAATAADGSWQAAALASVAPVATRSCGGGAPSVPVMLGASTTPAGASPLTVAVPTSALTDWLVAVVATSAAVSSVSIPGWTSTGQVAPGGSGDVSLHVLSRFGSPTLTSTTLSWTGGGTATAWIASFDASRVVLDPTFASGGSGSPTTAGTPASPPGTVVSAFAVAGPVGPAPAGTTVLADLTVAGDRLLVVAQDSTGAATPPLSTGTGAVPWVSTVLGVTAAPEPGRVRLDWAPVPSADGYEVRRDGGTPASAAPGVVDVTTTPDAGHAHEVRATVGSWRGAWAATAVGPCSTGLAVIESARPLVLFEYGLAVDGTGDRIAYASEVTSVVPGDTNGVSDVFVRDVGAGTVELVSRSTGGSLGNGESGQPALSADGRYVAFSSTASNLVAGDTNGATRDVFVRDRIAGTTTLVSRATGGAVGDSFSGDVSLSPNGRYVAFSSGATNLVAGDTNGEVDVFVRDTLAGTTQRVSVSSSGTQSNGVSWASSVDDTGRVAFHTQASNLVAGDTNGTWDVIHRDPGTGTTTALSRAQAAAVGDGASERPRMSADGRWVSFRSQASDLVAGDTNGVVDLFVRDTVAGTTTRVSLSGWGTQLDADIEAGNVSDDGRWVTWSTSSGRVVPGDANSVVDAFVRDVTTGAVTRLSVRPSFTGTASPVLSPVLVSGDGQSVVFRWHADTPAGMDSDGDDEIHRATRRW